MSTGFFLKWTFEKMDHSRAKRNRMIPLLKKLPSNDPKECPQEGVIFSAQCGHSNDLICRPRHYVSLK